MAGRKKDAAETSKPQTGSPPAASSETTGQPPSETKKERKPWIKKTPVEHVLDQIGNQEKKVADMREELKKEEEALTKLQQAKKLLEGA